MDDFVRIEEWRAELPGVVVEVEPRRGYVSGRFAAQLLGYARGEPSARPGGMAPARRPRGAGRARATAGRVSRGRDGGESIEVDTLGRAVRPIRREEPRAGVDVVTTVDRRIQEVAERALGNAPGAVVVMDPRNGDLLAIVSAPVFDLTRLTGPMDRDEWLRLVRDPKHSLLNWAFQTEYPPGSIFKLVVAAAAFREGVITRRWRCRARSRRRRKDRHRSARPGQRLETRQDPAWFGGYAPVDDPRVVVVVLVDRGGTGGRVAASIAREIFREVFRRAVEERPA